VIAYLPREWSDDPVRREKAGLPEEIECATKPEIATGQLREARQSGALDGSRHPASRFRSFSRSIDKPAAALLPKIANV